jgi:hypothetical protein
MALENQRVTLDPCARLRKSAAAIDRSTPYTTKGVRVPYRSPDVGLGPVAGRQLAKLDAFSKARGDASNYPLRAQLETEFDLRRVVLRLMTILPGAPIAGARKVATEFGELRQAIVQRGGFVLSSVSERETRCVPQFATQSYFPSPHGDPRRHASVRVDVLASI